MSQETNMREIIILTKSKKYNNLCVAGIDIKSGEWIRLVSEDTSIKGAIEPKDLIYKNGNEADILEKVSVVIKDGEAPWYHPENKILDVGWYLNYSGVVDSKYLNKFIDSGKEYIFFNNNKKVLQEELEDADDIYSLILIEVNRLHIYRDEYNSEKIKANFCYNNNWYNYITITDLQFLEKYDELIPEVGEKYILKNVKVVLSLGEEYEGAYYKLIASIIE